MTEEEREYSFPTRRLYPGDIEIRERNINNPDNVVSRDFNESDYETEKTRPNKPEIQGVAIASSPSDYYLHDLEVFGAQDVSEELRTDNN